MDEIPIARNVLDIPIGFDFGLLNTLDGENINLNVEDWIYISLICSRSDIFRKHEDPETVELFQERVRNVAVAAYNRYANKHNYAKMMVEKGLWPNHSRNGRS
jgi:hypothetical protein